MKSRNVWRLANSLVRASLCVCSLLSVIAAQAAENWQFREPRTVRYTTDSSPFGLQGADAPSIEVYPENNPEYRMELTKRVVVRCRKAGQVVSVMARSPLIQSRQIDDRTFVYEAPDAWTAAGESARLAALDEVEVCTPVFRRPGSLNGAYAPRSNDPRMPDQWHLENRDAKGESLGADINIRAAWPYAKGEGINVGVVDIGVELAHPDLQSRTTGNLHHNFYWGDNDGNPKSSVFHGTSVAGLITAETSNGIGLAGAAPLAKVVSMVIFNNSSQATDEQFAQMFNYATDQIQVQNHSWGPLNYAFAEPSFLETIAISDAVTLGRDGRGVVMVRAGGNWRSILRNVNDDAYASSPDAIAVAAADANGKVSNFSNRGACLLVGAPGNGLKTASLTGLGGYNESFSGTSGSAPLVSGIVALMLSANTNLNLRDVEHVLVQSARHVYFADPAIQTNGAGLLTSDNVGFGIPDAGVAVKLAQTWSNLPPRMRKTYSQVTGVAIPEMATRLEISGPNVPANLISIQAYPTDDGPRVEGPMGGLPLVEVGYATNAIAVDLTGKGALIERGPGRDSTNATLRFTSKIARAVEAGAKFVVFFSDSNVVEELRMDVDDFSPIPAIFINREFGLALKDYLTQEPSATARPAIAPAILSFNVPDTMVCEHVGIKLTTDHPLRSDLRITLTSPSGTVSVLQAVNFDATPGPVGWTYYTTQCFYEASKGIWKVQMSDELRGSTGLLTEAELIINGISITDSDADGLDDNWELAKFGDLNQGPKDDPDGDGWQNSREQIRGTNPTVNDEVFALDVSPWNTNFMRLSWAGVAGKTYTAKKFTGTAFTPTTLTNITGKFPVTELFLPYTNTTSGFIFLQRPAP